MVETVTLRLFEVFEKISKASTKKEKIELLKKYNSPALLNILKGTFDDTIEWLLPDGNPPYTPADAHNAASNLMRKYADFKYFVKGGAGNNLLPIKRETMFIGMLETIHPKDAELVISMIKRESPAKGITKTLVKEVFPDLIKK
jgi:hypothetical protein